MPATFSIISPSLIVLIALREEKKFGTFSLRFFLQQPVPTFSLNVLSAALSS